MEDPKEVKFLMVHQGLALISEHLVVPCAKVPAFKTHLVFIFLWHLHEDCNKYNSIQ